MQSAILQVQGDCEKLNITTSNLIEDHRQKQKDIEVSSRGAPGVERRLIRPTHPCHSALPTLPFLCPVGLQVLYQGIERLEKEKADREHLEMEIDVVSLWLVPSQRGGMEVEELGWGRQGMQGQPATRRQASGGTFPAHAGLSRRKRTRALWHPK